MNNGQLFAGERNNYYPTLAYIAPGVRNLNYRANDLIDDVCSYFNVSKAELQSKSRLRPSVEARQVAMYFMRERFSSFGIKKIGGLFNRNHATVIHSTRLVQEAIQYDAEYRAKVKELNSIIDSHIMVLSERK